MQRKKFWKIIKKNDFYYRRSFVDDFCNETYIDKKKVFSIINDFIIAYNNYQNSINKNDEMYDEQVFENNNNNTNYYNQDIEKGRKKTN